LDALAYEPRIESTNASLYVPRDPSMLHTCNGTF